VLVPLGLIDRAELPVVGIESAQKLLNEHLSTMTSSSPTRRPKFSLIWYGNKSGIEDRVFRIGTERSGATSLPDPRISHDTSARPSTPSIPTALSR